VVHSKIREVAILHRTKPGDALVQDGGSVVMIKAENVSEGKPQDESDLIGRERLELVRKIYKKLQDGELDAHFLMNECVHRSYLIV